MSSGRDSEGGSKRSNRKMANETDTESVSRIERRKFPEGERGHDVEIYDDGGVVIIEQLRDMMGRKMGMGPV